ncbi:MAG: hypothetical protein KME60_07205 [Cyanomargarita calcarea GSE-NOS-MK-12-04C]|jgi:hypothetical protein|uniref:TonB C-terminal domain-containing protein n=1 Tax=Cyanomargarita calcarea GSE-NOS-MK-12-04C TaxID=2839659 RepID=A0A951QJT8_9CYAN|nr:hypothetical protein [Cyanomargarita calcarea GSE-NOS-MK-12-04C]
MSYVSLLKNIPDILSQPAGIAAIASVGLHGAIAIIMPLMPVESSKPKETVSASRTASKTKTVGVVELNKAQLSRLPQPAPQIGALPPIPQAALQGQVPLPNINATQGVPLQALPPMASTSLLLPPIPKSLDNYRTASLPKGQSSIKIVPRTGLQMDRSFNARTTGAQPFPRFENRGTNRDFSQDVTIGASRNLPPSPPSSLPTLPAAGMPNGLPVNSYPNNYASAPASLPPETSATPPVTPPASEVSGSGVATNSLVAPVGQTLQPGDNLALGGESLPQWNSTTGSRIPELPSQTIPKQPSVGIQQALLQLDGYEDLKKTVQQQYPSAELKSAIRQTLASSKPGVEGAVLGGLVVDSDGKVIDVRFQGERQISPEIKSAVREHFRANPFTSNGKISYYPFNLKFQGDSGNGSIVPNLRSPQGTSKPPSEKTEARNVQPLAVPSVTSKPLAERLRNVQLAPVPQVTSKPLAQRLRSVQSAPAPSVTSKPLSEVPEVKIRNIPSLPTSVSVDSNPVARVRIRNNQVMPIVPTPGVRTRNNQTAPAEERTSKPAVEPVKINRVVPSPQATSSSSESATEGSQKLLQQLRQVREKRQNSEQEK